MPKLLLIADMEGVAGVDSLPQIIAGTFAYEQARELMTAEINAAISAFQASGFDHVIVSDSHRGGSETTNVLPEKLHPIAQLILEEDAYAAAWFQAVDAVVCIGMHAAAGTQGFAAHTVSVQCAWRWGEKNISESDIVGLLAAEHGIPLLMVSGDQVLQQDLVGRCAYAQVKNSTAVNAAQSLTQEQALRNIATVARTGTAPHNHDKFNSALPLQIIFKSCWQADWASRYPAVKRLSDYAVEIGGETFRARYELAHRLTQETIVPILQASGASPGSSLLNEHVAELLSREIPEEKYTRLPSGNLPLTAQAFLFATNTTNEFSICLRALILHMLDVSAPQVFAKLQLADPLAGALAQLRDIQFNLPVDMPSYIGMSRIDAWYILHERNLITTPIDSQELSDYLRHIQQHGNYLHALIIDGMMRSKGYNYDVRFPQRKESTCSRLLNVYWLTHEFLFQTHYLRYPLATAGWESRIEECFLATPWAIAKDHRDLAAELALCMQMAGEHHAPRHRELLNYLLSKQRADGLMTDESMGEAAELTVDHATSVLLLMLAGAEEWNIRRGLV